MINTVQLFGTPSKRVMDPVHGSIPIFTHEMKVIDDPLFQRLRHILQNDVVFLVFPGAKHNRLLHSIGTMHMVSSLFTQITSSYFLTANNNKEISTEQRNSINYIHYCLRLAALLHDSGHSPFSHQFENTKAIEDILTPELFEKLWGEINYSQFYRNSVRLISHEHFSVRISYEILRRQNIFSKTGIAIEDVLFFMETTENTASATLLNHCKNFINIFVEGFETKIGPGLLDELLYAFLTILKSFISGELDADKMDYILRDSYFSGCRYGAYNKDHLINSLRLGFQPFMHKDATGNNSLNIFDVELSLAILEKGVGALEDFIYARYQLYLEVYNHKTVSGFRKLLSIALSEIVSEPDNKSDVELKLSTIEGFQNFTDTYFWEKFRNYSKNHPNSACGMLINRKKLRYIGKRINEDKKEIELECKRLSKSKGKKIEFWESKVKFSKINERFNFMKVLVKKEDGSRHLDKISNVTNFFAKFDKKDIYHLFEIPDFKAP